MEVIPKVWMLYLGYGCYAEGVDVIPWRYVIWMLYQMHGCYSGAPRAEDASVDPRW